MASLTVGDLWIERAAEVVGFDRVGERVFGTTAAGPYLLMVTIVLVHLPLLSLVGWLQTGVLSFAVNPGEIFQVVAWPAVVWILLRTKSKYEATINDLPEPVDADIRGLNLESPLTSRLLSLVGLPADTTGKADAALDTLVHRPVRRAILVGGLVLYGLVLATDPSSVVGPVADLTGSAVAAVRFYVVIPFVLYPIGAEFVAVVVGVLVLLPFKIERATLVDFSDPHGFAGLAPAGTLFKSVAVSYFILVALFAVFQTVATGTSPTGLFSSTLLAGGLLLGLGLFLGPLLRIKSYLAAAKEAKIEALAEASRQVGSTDDLFPYAEPESTDDASQYTYNHIRMQRVQSTSELPIDFAMVQEILFALVLPYVSSLLFDFVVQTVA